MPSISNDPCNCASGSSSSWNGASYNVYATCTETTTETSTVNQNVYARNIDVQDVNATRVSCSSLVVAGTSITSGLQNITATPGNTTITGNLNVTDTLSFGGSITGELKDCYTSGDFDVYGKGWFKDHVSAKESQCSIPLSITEGRGLITTSANSYIVLQEDIPNWTSRVTVSYCKLKVTGTAGTPVLQYGLQETSTSVITWKTTGYSVISFGYVTAAAAVTTLTTGVPIYCQLATTGSNTWVYNGVITFSKVGLSSDVWNVNIQGNRDGKYPSFASFSLTVPSGSILYGARFAFSGTDTFQSGAEFTAQWE